MTLERAKRPCAAAPAAAACGWKRRSASASTSLRVEQALEHRQPQVIATACPYCAVMVSDGLGALNSTVASKDIAELVAEALVQPQPVA
jgi:Fe-S oxidoreductase